MCVGAFHGPAHNRICQFDNSPRNISGTGLTDFENCERLFSSTNRLAGTTRLASKHHRLQKIHNHLRAFDEDTYLGLGTYLRTRYTDTLRVLELAEAVVEELCPDATDADMERFRLQERMYLESLKTELPEDTFAIGYLDLLEKLEQKQVDYNKAFATTFQMVEGRSLGDLRRAAMHTSRLESWRRTTLTQLELLQNAVAQMEDDHGVVDRWTCESDDWKKAETLRHRQHYQFCVDELERLVILRLLELSKAGLEGTGYKLRQHIMKALMARSAAVKSSLTRYNQAAVDLHGAKARTFTWEQVSQLSVLNEFELLKDSRRQPLDQDWAKPEVRQCVEQWHLAQRAAEEIIRLNVEARRVRTSLAHEAISLPAAASQIQSANAGLGWAAERYVSRRLKTNAIVSHELELLEKHPGFTGSRDVGVRIGSGVCEVPGQPGANNVLDLAPINAADHSHDVRNEASLELSDYTEEPVHDVDEDGLSELVAHSARNGGCDNMLLPDITPLHHYTTPPVYFTLITPLITPPDYTA
ncbi:hypothetical protein FRC12_001050 [Ceratobasidium sp. 428]|nr:hypothetical protein FRC12_001050 [Ceratobasidium sp. 428]